MRVLAVTPMRKLAALCEFFGVRTALHGPGDCSPVGMMANLMLDLAVPNFGIQEYNFGHGDAVHNNIGGDRSSYEACCRLFRAPQACVHFLAHALAAPFTAALACSARALPSSPRASGAVPSAAGWGEHRVRDGMMWPSGLPGLGIDIDEDVAKEYPWAEGQVGSFMQPLRRKDGSWQYM